MTDDTHAICNATATALARELNPADSPTTGVAILTFPLSLEGTVECYATVPNELLYCILESIIVGMTTRPSNEPLQ